MQESRRSTDAGARPSRRRWRWTALAVACGVVMVAAYGPAQDCNRNGIPDEDELDAPAWRLRLAGAYRAQAGITSLAAADFEGDGSAFLCASLADGIILTFQKAWHWASNGTGRLTLGGTAFATVASDLDGDGRQDLVTFFRERNDSNAIAVHPWLGRSSGGSFGQPILSPLDLPQAGTPGVLVPGDVDGDGHFDLVVAHLPGAATSGGVSLLLGEAGGRFRLSGELGTGDLVPLLGDFDGDGRLDLLTTEPAGDRVFLQSGRGDGTFGPVTSFPSRRRPVWPAAGDLDGDGDLDVAVANEISYSIALFVNDGAGSLQAAGELPAAQRPRRVTAADLDQDGRLDLITTHPTAGVMQVRLQRAGGIFATPFDPPSQVDQPLHLALADLDGDGRLDMAVAGSGSNQIVIHVARPLFPTSDCNRNGILDACEVAAEPGLDANRNGLPDECEELPPDCNLNGIPDAVEIARGLVLDCDRNGIPDDCEDCNGNGIPDGCDIANGFSADCDGNGIPDECQIDCNRNGVADGCDVLEGGGSRDEDRNGVPDECQRSALFHLGLRGPDRVQGAPGSAVSFEVRAQLAGVGLPEGPGAQGWSIIVGVRGCRILDATTAGTASAPALLDPAGRQAGGFDALQMADTRTKFGEPIQLLMAGVVLSFTQPVTLDPGNLSHDVLRFEVEGMVPDTGCRPCSFFYTNGFPGTGQPVATVVTYKGDTAAVIVGGKQVALCPPAACTSPAVAAACGQPLFRRGDPQQDGVTNIVDAISLLLILFTGRGTLDCLEAADVQNDGRIDIADAVFLLEFLFRGGTPPAPPGSYPGPCGVDTDPPGSPRDLGCREYRRC
jgi:hypothetical protein